MIDFEPKYITFDMHGTLIRWHMADMTPELLADIVPTEQMDYVIHRCEWQCLGEVLHVSASPRYNLMVANDLGIKALGPGRAWGRAGYAGLPLSRVQPPVGPAPAAADLIDKDSGVLGKRTGGGEMEAWASSVGSAMSRCR